MDKKYITLIVDLLKPITEIPQKEINYLESILKTVILKKGEYFSREGVVPNYISFFIVKGLIRKFFIDDKGVDITINFSRENDFVGPYREFIQQQPAMLNYEALEDSCLFVLDRKHFTELLDRNACWQIIKNSILEKFFIQKSNRESQLLSKDAETRYQQFLMDFPNLEHRLKNYHIASYLGISPETLSRIRTKNKIYVVNKRARSS